jgi:hypothetical protein
MMSVNDGCYNNVEQSFAKVWVVRLTKPVLREDCKHTYLC